MGTKIYFLKSERRNGRIDFTENNDVCVCAYVFFVSKNTFPSTQKMILSSTLKEVSGNNLERVCTSGYSKLKILNTFLK